MAICGTQRVSTWPSQAMDSMPWEKTSGMPAALAKSVSTWMGLWSPEAPQYSANVSREIGGVSNDGRASSTWMPSKFSAVAFMSALLCVADHRDTVQVGHQFVALVGHARLAHHELKRAALLVINVGYALLEGQRVARIGHGM